MFEIKLALRYLIPRWRQLSVSIISLLSVAVIALVVWLVIVFFSVTLGLERGWTEKMIALTAPLRVQPTEAYVDSYYFQIDAFSLESDYTLRSLSEKLEAPESDPYDPDVDTELPPGLAPPDLDDRGDLKDLAALAVKAIETTGVARDYEMAVANVRLHLQRPNSREPSVYLSQASFLLSFDPENALLGKTLQGVTEEDRTNSQRQLAAMGLEPELIEIEPTDKGWRLPRQGQAYGILISRHFRDSGVLIGDRGQLTYHTPTASSIQEQQIPVFVAGFYDPGVIGIGGKMVLVDKGVTSLVRAGRQQQEDVSTTGFNVWIPDYQQADRAKATIEAELEARGIARYFTVQTYKEYDFTRAILQQLKSDRNLFTIISFLIILVACSNIITLLILLVNDKKREIGVLRAMGATATSVAIIFGLCGLIMGAAGGLIGTALAVFTLRNIRGLMDLLSALQGFEAFSEAFYGETLPNALSLETLLFVLAATTLLSLFAAAIPAVKAALLKPAAVLRSE